MDATLDKGKGLIFMYSSFIQSTVATPLSLEMALLILIKAQLRELWYSSGVTQGLAHLGGWQQCVEQMGGGTLTLLLLCAHVSLSAQRS